MFSNPNQRLYAIRKLAELADECDEIEDDILNIIRKVAGPAPVAPVVPNPLEPITSEIVLARDGEKINAIKMYRTRTGLGLKESKDAIERSGHLLGFMDSDGRYSTKQAS